MKRRIAKILAGLIVWSVGISSILFFALAFDYHLLVFPCILNLIAFIFLLYMFEDIVEDLIKMIDVLRL